MKPLVLIGMMGSGKTTIGKALSKDLNLTWVDTDDYIQEQTHEKISTIFETRGEAYFRNSEKDALQSVLNQYECISTGGGIIITPENRDLIQKDAFVIHLTAKIDTLVNRLTTDDRPLLKDGPIEEKLSSLLQARSNLYKDCADLTIVTDQLSIDEVVSQIKTKLFNEIA